ncbi:hypothetical protein LBMAG53_38700 [Planctomycetota bacterium]|nr:hypothetical protein LBMAG53_38700 [Planctomycetota bacterium]
MGFFDFLFGKKKATPQAPVAPAGDTQASRRSRRAIPAGGKPASRPAEAAAPASAAIQRPSTAPVAKPDGGLVLATPTATERLRGDVPIAGSKPPQFGGSLVDQRRGVCRTGDPAMLDFLTKESGSRPPLLNAEQTAQVKVTADQQEIAVDMAAVRLGFITEDQLVNALTQECWVPHLKVDKYEIRKKALDTVDKDDAVYYGVFPVDKLGSLLTLAMANPLDAATIDALAAKTGLDIKKVVATRAEIGQGIDKYYGGKVQAKDTSISFTQDIEPKSVTAMMAKVSTTSGPHGIVPSTPAPAPAPAPVTSRTTSQRIEADITPEIQDIDDLLAGDETIAPAIIEPISLKAEEFEEVGISPPTTSRVAASAEAPAAVAEQPYEPFDLEDTGKIAPVPRPRLGADTEFAEDAATPVGGGALERPAGAAPIAPEFSPPSATPPAAPAKAAPAPRPAAPSAASPTTGPRRAAGPATGRVVSADAKAPTVSGSVHLVPVTEAEFQHAISHGRSHLFDKWIGLQTRNRIINAVPVERDLEPVLAELFRHPAKAA